MKGCQNPKNKKLGMPKSRGDKKIIILVDLCQIRPVYTVCLIQKVDYVSLHSSPRRTIRPKTG
jgi:hypothetical protein